MVDLDETKRWGGDRGDIGREVNGGDWGDKGESSRKISR